MSENAFEAGTRRAIPAVLIYLRSVPTTGSVPEILMVHRNRSHDFHEGKWNGLGGKMDPGESPLETAARELQEESGLALDPDRFQILGTLQFPAFKASKTNPEILEDWWVVVLTSEITAGERAKVQADSPEGKLEWIPTSEILNLNLWEGDRYFLPKVLEKKPLFGTFWYEAGKLSRFDLEIF